ncbi:hypothetical protein MHJ98_03630 [Corynebacterium afermentans]|uniref:AMIN-like domain-containing (lipo)protein n=1 Tax=Corynebacterium afermentans TaxID=38286 RepID=UPI002573E57F|nr:hypothetical protein [Corynebacterium afermentans]MCG7291447.1 hypothetical protein [Corynebacterium afermentans]
MFKFSGLSRVALAGACVAVSVACSACSVVGDGAGKTLTGSLASPAKKPQPLGAADSSSKTQRPSEPSRLAVVGVRVGAHEGFDRVVVDLAGDGDPGWFVDYTSTPMQETVGQPLQVAGNSFLNINVDGTVYPFELGKDNDVPVTMAGDTGNVIDVISAGTYEGRSQVVVGLRSELPYSVQVLKDPTRVVVDIVQK